MNGKKEENNGQLFSNLTKVIAYDIDGVAHVLYDGTETAAVTYPTMPELKTGMFIILERKEKYYGFVYNNKIIWQNGGWDYVASIHTDKRYEGDMKGKLTIYEKDKINWFPEDNYKNYIFWTGEVWYG